MDCTHTFRTGASTGIQRVVRHFVDGLLALSRDRDIEVLPVRVEDGQLIPLPLADGRVAFPRSQTAREATLETDGPARRVQRLRAVGHRLNFVRSRAWSGWLDAGPNDRGLERALAGLSKRPKHAGAVDLRRGDIVLSLDSSWVYDIRTALDAAGRAGAARVAVLCDVLPVTHPEWFTAGTRHYFEGWLEALLPRLEGLVTISAATRDELQRLVADRRLQVARVPPCKPIHLGAELQEGDGRVRQELKEALPAGGAPAFLTVGTLEPRKNVDYALDIFDALLARGFDVRWHIVGAPGWLASDTAERIRGHARFGHALHWWTDLTDAELSWAYSHAAALVAVSRAEGFGLPLVEARFRGLPVFASDIPVFREVLGAEGRYLPLGGARLAAAVLEDFLRGALPVPQRSAPSAAARPWAERTSELLDAVLELAGKSPSPARP